jgi:hypothetical protein
MSIDGDTLDGALAGDSASENLPEQLIEQSKNAAKP